MVSVSISELLLSLKMSSSLSDSSVDDLDRSSAEVVAVAVDDAAVVVVGAVDVGTVNWFVATSTGIGSIALIELALSDDGGRGLLSSIC